MMDRTQIVQPGGTKHDESRQDGSPKAMVADYGLTERVNGILDFPSAEVNPSVLGAYPELTWLTGDVNATPEGIATTGQAASLSEQLFNKRHIEFDRTAVGMMVLKWVIKGDYDGFTACQADPLKLSRQSFNELREYTHRILPDAKAIDAMITYIVINDLGKIQSVVAQVKSAHNVENVDHDKILLSALEKDPDISPSFQRLSSRYRDLIVAGLKAEFSIAQFIQGENVAASLGGLSALNQESLDFYLLHALCDIAGAAGHVKQNGAMVMTEPTYQGFKMSIGAINRMASGASSKEVYDYYLSQRAETLGFDISDSTQKALTKICCMLRVSDSGKATEVKNVFEALPANTRAILTQELNRSGVDDGYATLLYYSPATLANALAAYSKAATSDAFSKGLSEGLTALARTYQEAVIATKAREGNGVYTVMVSALAEAAKTPDGLTQIDINLHPVGEDAEVVVKEKRVINALSFSRIGSLAEIAGERVAVIGIGGGSDGIQAAQLANLLESSGKICPCIISIRTAKTGSQGQEGRIGERRTIQNHGGEIAQGVFVVTPETTGSGRFLENIPASTRNMFLVIDYQNDTVHSQIQAVLNYVQGVDTVVAVDTGGDALYSALGQEQAKATPDQDLRILQALSRIELPVISCEIACGVDSPEDAESVLQNAKAKFYQPTSVEAGMILDTYEEWEMDGRNPKRFGKTPLAWQAALMGKQGYECMPLPVSVVTDRVNPWNPFIYIDGKTTLDHEGSMSGIFFMELSDHLHAIGASTRRA